MSTGKPLLGWIPPEKRTQAQHVAHERAMAQMPRFTLSPPRNTGPVKVMLTDFWKTPEVIADIGFEFNGFRQLTGSCVGASDGTAVCTASCVQRMTADHPTKAFLPFWPFAYGRTRYNEGDRGEGEGAVDSVMGQTIGTEGSLWAGENGLPQYDRSDGLALTTAIEMQWSDGGSSVVTKWLPKAKPYTVGTRAPLHTPDDIKASILNGYPVLDGCNNYVGKGSIKGSGANAYVTGKYDGRGGHSTCYLGYWDHPNDGPLFLYSNNWDATTYATDPAGAGRCCVWLPLSETEKLFQNGGDNGETMAISHLNYLPANPAILDWFA